MHYHLARSCRVLFARLLHAERLLCAVVILSMILPGLASSARAGALFQDDVGTPTPTASPTAPPEPGDDLAPTPTTTETATATATATLTDTLPSTTPTATAALTATVTVTPTQAITPTASMTAMATLTPTLTPTPTEEPTLTPSATPTTPAPTLTPSVTPTLEPTLVPTATLPAGLPTPTPTILPTATITASLPVSLTLEGLGGGFTPGEPFAVAWSLDSTALDLPGLEMLVSAPAGFTPSADLVGSFDLISNTLTLPSPLDEGQMVWNVPPEAEVSFSLQASLRAGGAEVVSATLVVLEEGLSLIPLEGGIASGLDGRVRVTFPAGATDDVLEVRVRYPSQDSQPG